MTDTCSRVLQFEKFLNETLKEDLRKALEARDKIFSQISEYLQLKTVIERLKETNLSNSELKTKTDIGCNFYIQAKVPDPSHIFVAVGLGVFVDFTLDEALLFINKKTARLTESTDSLTKKIAQIKAHIKLVLEGLRELQNLSGEVDKPMRDVF
ncbi:protein UXT-like [Gigantopelta aegis]|uniref:protein UXT-like n=1 Tax=Gigantopelta aegis TaxID=1735272 RepID=UPI001B88C1AE|nr:protein UXT-like [Gigantopelta aegis]